MSISITGGISFSGGVGITAAPPSQATAAWFGGGFNATSNISTVQRITFATDTNTATVRGPLSYTNFKGAGTGTLTDGWFGGGYTGGGFASVFTRVTYATDTNTSTNRGAISQVRWGLAATTDGTTYGWFGGGYSYPPPPDRQQSTVDRITYANDTATATVRGPLATARIYLAATGNTTDGWYGGGQSPGQSPGGTGQLSTVNRITYATDTATATAKGPLSLARHGSASVTDGSTYGWFGGGYTGAGNVGTVSTVDRITYANDTATASLRGPLAQTVSRLAGGGDSTNGYFGGGYSLSPYGRTSNVHRITYATDTATASLRGTLSVAAWYLAASSGVQ
jgi:hypothetical protein